jgi:hypothetical protein
MKRGTPAQFAYFFLLPTLLLPIVLGGCVNKSHWVWKHPEKPTELEFLSDKKECNDLAQEESSKIDYYYGYRSLFSSPFYTPYYHDRYSYHPFANDDRYFRQQDDLERFFRVCMKAKGWELVKVEKKKE